MGKWLNNYVNGDNVSSIARIARRGNVGTRILSARTGNFDNSTPNTFRMIAEIGSNNFSAVRPIFTNGGVGVTYTVASCTTRPAVNFTDAVVSPTTVTLPSGGVVPASAATNQPNYLLGNWTYLSSTPRNDGGKGAIVYFDGYVSTAGTINILGNGTNDIYTGWATRATRKLKLLNNAGDCITTPANFVSTTLRNQSIFAGFQYIANNRVVTVLGPGDSINDGRGSIIGEGFGTLACEELSDVDTLVYEWANVGYAGANSTSYSNYLTTLIAAGVVPDIVIFGNGSPNDYANTITEANINTSKQNLAKMLLTCRDNQLVPLIYTQIPVNPNVKPLNATDSLRRDYNKLTLERQGHHLLDFDGALSGITDSNGQVNFKVGTTTDGIHPNDAGNLLLKTVAVRGISSIEV